MGNNKVWVLVVDDSSLFRTAISRGLDSDPSIEVVAVAKDAVDARDKILQYKPDVLTLDIQMPNINGIQFLKMMMPQRPMPVIVVSAVDGIVFEALHAGAVDFVQKPSGGNSAMQSFTSELAEKIIVASNAKTSGLPGTKRSADSGASPVSNVAAYNGLIVIGASTGGTEATSRILKQLPKNMPGIVVTQHMPEIFTEMYAKRIDKECSMSASEAKDGDIVKRGHVYIAPGGDTHTTVEKQGTNFVIKVKRGDKVNGHCPSVDVLFDSVAKIADSRTIGVILTGMGADGAKGLLKMKRAGAYTIGQDKATSVVYGMPMEAYSMGAVTRQMPLEAISEGILTYMMAKS